MSAIIARLTSWIVALQAAWEGAVVQDIMGSMAALRFFCRDLEQAQQQGLAHLHSLHLAEAQVRHQHVHLC